MDELTPPPWLRLRAGFGSLVGESVLVAWEGALVMATRASSLGEWEIARGVREGEIERSLVRSTLILRTSEGDRSVQLGSGETSDLVAFLERNGVRLGPLTSEPAENAPSETDDLLLGDGAPRLEANAASEALEGQQDASHPTEERSPELDEERARLLQLFEGHARLLALLEHRRVTLQTAEERATIAQAWTESFDRQARHRAEAAERKRAKRESHAKARSKPKRHGKETRPAPGAHRDGRGSRSHGSSRETEPRRPVPAPRGATLQAMPPSEQPETALVERRRHRARHSERDDDPSGADAAPRAPAVDAAPAPGSGLLWLFVAAALLALVAFLGTCSSTG